jgi:glycosyltransferase involved in cell wall biosynthesis
VNIERLLEDDGLRKRLGTAARQHVLGNYTDDIMAEKTIAFYQRLFTRKTDTPQQKQARVSD